VDKAVVAAEKAFEGWANTPKADRGAIMIKIADIIESRLDEFAAAESNGQW
jgi:acyl-CoA reductase-like NAD-dependent aldehyde dehydrogenase